MWNKKTAGTLILSLAFLTSDSINGVALPWYTCSIATGFVVFAGSRYRYSRGFIKAMKKVLLIVLLPYFAATAYTLFSVLTYGGGGHLLSDDAPGSIQRSPGFIQSCSCRCDTADVPGRMR